MPDKESLHIGLKRDFGELSRTVVRIRVIIIPGRDLRIDFGEIPSGLSISSSPSLRAKGRVEDSRIEVVLTGGRMYLGRKSFSEIPESEVF